ncbi:MAG: condensation domain-containing protein [Dehalococcoidia bacterium]|nr:condensation domain-containing protein [Dehalococcoidia bacterium]
MSKQRQTVSMNCIDMTWLALDSINERIIFHAILVVEGEVDPLRLNDAIVTTVRRHPALRTVLRRKFLRHYREYRDDIGSQILETHDMTGLGESEHKRYVTDWVNRPLDPKKELPFRVLLLKRGPARYWLAFTFHHYATDALRALRFVNEIMAVYNRGEVPVVAADGAGMEDTIEAHRTDELLPLIQRPKSKVRWYYPKIASSLFHRFVVSAFTPPSRIFHDKPGNSGEVSFVRTWLESIELSEIDAKSRVLGATVNDVLLAACFKTIEKWNKMHGKPSGKISIMVPVDVGRKMSQHVVSNQISYVSPFTMPEERTDHIGLLKRVSQRTGCVIRNGNAFSMIYFTYFLSRLSFAIMRIVGILFIATRVYIDTTLLTNVGRIRLGDGREPRLGDARITDIFGVTPVVTPWGMSIVTAVFNGKLHLGLTYRPARFSDETARRFLDLYVEEIKSYVLALETA